MSLSVNLSANIEQAIRAALPPRERYALHEPAFAGNEWDYVKSCLDEGWVSSVGAFVDRFEADLAAFAEVNYAVVCVNGTAALQVALQLAGVRPGDEVLVPALTFVATANSIAYCGAAPWFVDSSAHDFGLDVAKLRELLVSQTRIVDGVCVNKQSGRPVRACVPVHVFGHACRMDDLLELCDEFGIAVIEDATEALGSRYRGRHVGGWGLASVLSFNGNKIMTTGGGGAILTNNAELARRAKHLTTTAKVPHAYEYVHDELGYNYRMPNINAALGCAQLELMGEFVRRKRALAERYATSFAELDDVRFYVEPATHESNYWLNALVLDAAVVGQRDAVLEHLNARRIHVRPIWTLLCDLPMYTACQSDDLTGARQLAAATLNLPSSVELCP